MLKTANTCVEDEVITPDRGASRKRVLLLAYACSPYKGSEEGVGWQRVVETAKYFDTWVICGKREFEGDVKRYIAEHGQPPGARFYFIGRTQLEKWIWKLPLGHYAGYHSWHRRAYRTALDLHCKHHFDIVHQVNWAGFREPGYLWKLGVPFVWGPVGGTQNYPWRFLMRAGVIGAVREGLRTALNWVQFRFSSRVRRAAKAATILLTSNSTGLRDFRAVHHVEPRLLLETGVSNIRDKVSPNSDPQKPLKILWSGEFTYNKSLPLLLRALAGLPPGHHYELKVLGKGPLERAWRGLSRRFGVEPSCRWMGWLSHADALKEYEWADVLVFTSLRDTSGNVVLEALSRGVPVICFDHQGVGDIVTAACGIKVPLTSPKRTVKQLTCAIDTFIVDRGVLALLSRGATKRATEYLWSRNGATMAQLYRQVFATAQASKR